MDKQQQQPKRNMSRKHRPQFPAKRDGTGTVGNIRLAWFKSRNQRFVRKSWPHQSQWMAGWQWIKLQAEARDLFSAQFDVPKRVFKPCHCQLPLLVPKPMRYDEHQPITMLITHSLERDPALHVAAWNWMRSTVIQHWPQPKTTLFLKNLSLQTSPKSCLLPVPNSSNLTWPPYGLSVLLLNNSNASLMSPRCEAS